MLKLHQVSTSIANVQVLRQLSAEFSQGQTIALVGRNGAGKTTLLRVIMGLLPKYQGEVILEGQNLANVPARERARLGIGYAPEDRIVFPTFSVQENLSFPCQVMGMSASEQAARLEETLSIVPELKVMLPRSGAALSGGQGKMVALGRALMVGTRLVLLDEPFQGLAPVLAQQYSASIARLLQARPQLCVLITESNRALLKDISHYCRCFRTRDCGTFLFTPISRYGCACYQN
jgi:ABC-type branched-subunit amino acid transport system ATPase component